MWKRKCGAATSGWVVLFLKATLITVCGCVNLVENGGFVGDGSWELQVREGLWDLRPAGPEFIHIGGGQDNSTRGLHFHHLGRNRELIVSQYIPEKRIVSSDVGKLARVKIMTRNLRGEGSYEVRLDISYEDGNYLFVKHEILTGRVQSSCHLVPKYGVIRAMYVHLVVTKAFQESITVDEVSIETVLDVKEYSAQCEAYLQSRPKHREILRDFLRPQVAPLTGGNQGAPITLVTQCTEDRLGLVEDSARVWRGHVAVALLVFNDQREATLKRITTMYHQSRALSRFVTIHVVLEDSVMNEDQTLYPVNFLRKFILNATDTDYVFYVDADVTPTFTHDVATRWLQDNAQHLDHQQTALIVPIFASKEESPEVPSNKTELLRAVQESRLTPLSVVSHSVINYPVWYKSKHIYSIQYQLNMEPYFIVHRSAPLINEMFEGYGRDKCAYSKELHHAQFKFYVLPYAFLINRKEPAGSKTILLRAGAVDVRVFLTTMFHDADMRQRFIRYRIKPPSMIKPSTEHCDVTTGHCAPEPAHETENLYTAETNINMEQFLDYETNDNNEDGGLSCGNLHGDLHPQPLPGLVGVPVVPQLIAITMERVIKLFKIGNFIHLLTALPGAARVTLPYTHPQNIINVIPNSPTTPLIHQPENNDLFTEYKSLNSLSTLLRLVRTRFTDPCVYWLSAGSLEPHEVPGNLSTVLEYSSNDDVIVVEGNNQLRPHVLMQEMCRLKKSWKLFRNEELLYVLKSSHFTPPHPIRPPHLDLTPLRIPSNGVIPLHKCPELKTDFILFTKNRPLHSHAFIESLLHMVSGINKLWLVAHSDSEDVSVGYQRLVECFSERLAIELLYDNEEGFGRVLDDVLHRSTADYIVMNVDEIIWLRPVDLKAGACVLHTLGDHQMATFQLRLGDNLKLPTNFDSSSKIVIGHMGLEEIHAFYPLWQPFDYGYMTHVDAPLISRARLHREVGPWLYDVTDPGSFENRWLRRCLHKHARTWHLTYKHSRLVNNKLGDRVTGTRGMTESNQELLKVYLEQHKTVDIERFRAEHLNNSHTHHTHNVHLKDNNCPQE